MRWSRPGTVGRSIPLAAGLLCAMSALPPDHATAQSGQARQPDFPVSAGLPQQARAFDFWVGEWDVNLRIRQDDGTWPDQVQATARVYPILGGKAILELWSDERVAGIKGYSLRYFDTTRDEWVLWLNWPGPNRSGSSSLAGSFRHGRGEFFSTTTNPDGEETISRYTFSDITPESLRWDDAFSSDGGRSWTHGWIMEFSRSGPRPSLAPEGGPAHTFHGGTRCDDEAFRRYEFLTGRNTGAIEAGGSGPVTITGYRILDGCALMTFAGPSSDPERAWGFSLLTFNTFADRYELTTLTSQPGTPVRMFYTADATSLLFYELADEGRPTDRMRIEQDLEGSIVWAHETPSDDDWRPVWIGRVRGR